LLKLGLCHQRLAAHAAQASERPKGLANARAAYERLIQQFPKHDHVPQAVLERAKCLAQTGDTNGAITELKRFTADPLKTTSVAPLAVLELATLLRSQNKPGEAADALALCRPPHEPKLLADPARAGWVPLLQYHHGVALKEAGKFPEARTVFELVMDKSPARPEAVEAAVRIGQCFLDEGVQKQEAPRKKLATPNLKPEEVTAATAALNEGAKPIRSALEFLEARAEQLRQKQPNQEARARMLYDAAWAARLLAEPERTAARAQVQAEIRKKLLEEAVKKSPAEKPPALLPVPEVPWAKVPRQPLEEKARALYQALIAAFPNLPLAGEARFELAELMAERDERDPALKLLQEALDKKPGGELADKIRLRVGACQLAQGHFKEALAQLDLVAKDPASPLAGQAHYRAGECFLRQGEWAKAAERLALFRDQPAFQNLPGLTDRALLRLGHALAHAKQWDDSRKAHEQVISRFPDSPWVHEARYGMGWAWQNQTKYDDAVQAYHQVTAGTGEEVAARAQLQIGLCRLEQKQYAEAAAALLVVPFTYDYPELSAVALCESARAFAELKQPGQARKLLERVVKDHPQSTWAGVARQRLEALDRS
jgi:TolA-binding protein